MTMEEAIKIIDCYDIGFYDLSGEKIPADKLADAFDMAIEALSANAVQGEWIRVGHDIYECSLCHQNVMTRDIDCYAYCHGCGARMLGEDGEA